jgi:hypothetical protein
MKISFLIQRQRLAMTYVPDPPDAGEELAGLPVPVLVGEEPPVPVLGGELTLLEPLVRQLESLPAWMVTMSE